MKVSLMSDLHIEWCPMPPMPGGETLLLSGDILLSVMTLKHRTDKPSRMRRERFEAFFKECSEKYKQVYYIAGNHESYDGDITKTPGYLREFVAQYPNVRYLDNNVTPMTDKTMLFGATMWTNLNNSDIFAIIAAKRTMNDFAGSIMNGKTPGPYAVALKYKPEDSVLEFEKTIKALTGALEAYPNSEFFVMTHHTPSFKSIHPKYGDDPLNYAYSSDLSKFILDNPRIKHWVHGHTHDTFKYSIGDCKVFCNPRGYTKNPNIYPENRFFDINFSFEVA